MVPGRPPSQETLFIQGTFTKCHMLVVPRSFRKQALSIKHLTSHQGHLCETITLKKSAEYRSPRSKTEMWMSMGSIMESFLEKSGTGLGMSRVDFPTGSLMGGAYNVLLAIVQNWNFRWSPELKLQMDYSRLQRFGETISKPYTMSLGRR